MSCELWSINRWLRFTGFRLYVSVDVDGLAYPGHKPNPDHQATRVGLKFYGWRGLVS